MGPSPGTPILFAPWPGEPTARRLLEAAERRGSPLALETPFRPPASIRPGTALLPRVGIRVLDESLKRLFALEGEGAVPVNRAVAIARVKRKDFLEELGRRGVPRPKGSLVTAERLPPLPFPFVSKRLVGARGEGVALVRSVEEWEIERRDGAPRLVEPYVSPDARTEWRVLVLRGTVLAACRKEPALGEFRATRALGGRFLPGDAPMDVLEIARAAAGEANLGFSGSDIVLPRGGEPLLLDVNDSPGLLGISEALERDLAGELLDGWLGEKSR